MKKIFTLIAVAFVALSVNAKQAIDISGIAPDGKITFTGTWNWQDVSLSSGELIENSEAKTADDSGVTYFDASAYDYLIVKYSSATCDANVIAQLKCKGTIGQWGAEYYTSEGPVAKKKKGGYAFVKLDPNYKKYVNSVAFQNGNDAGEIIIDEVYWATEAEYQEALDGLAAGEVSELVTSQYGIHIIKCTEVFTAPEELTSLDQLPADFQETFKSMAASTKASTAYQEWLEKLKESADIKINDMPSNASYNIDLTKYQQAAESASAASTSADAAGVESASAESESAESASAESSSGN